jgi:hypothetical protein
VGSCTVPAGSNREDFFHAAPVTSIPQGQALARLKSGALIFHVNVTLRGALLVMTATVPKGLELRWSVT